jgi:thymidylate synthase
MKTQQDQTGFRHMSKYINEEGYLEVMKEIWTNGETRSDRTGVGTKAVFGVQVGYDLNNKFPLLTTKKVAFKTMAIELEWFLKGDNNIRFLEENGCTIWTEWPYKGYLQSNKLPVPAQESLEWKSGLKEFRKKIIEDKKFAKEYGSIGPGAYGTMWRGWPGINGVTIDQLQEVVETLKKNPYSRRNLVVGFNPTFAAHTYLPPCHSLFQFYVDSTGGLVCELYQRSADYFLGVPFNVTSYSLLTYILASITELTPRAFIHTMADTHIYLNHKDAITEQISRTPTSFPILQLPKLNSLEDFTWQMAVNGLQDYEPQPMIKAPVAV